MKKIIITGNVGKDPEQRFNAAGEAFVTASFAVTTGSKNNQKTDWMELLFNKKNAEIAVQYVKKGTKLLIEGTPNAHAYISKAGAAVAQLRVNVTNFEFIGGKPEAESENFENVFDNTPF